MTEITQTLVMDDFDTSSPADETLLWVFDGEAVRSDLTAENAAALREAVAPFLSAARSLGKQKVTGSGKGRTKKVPRSSSPAVAPRVEQGAGEFDPRWYRSIRNGPGRVEAAKKRYRDWAREWGEENGFAPGFRLSDEIADAYERYRREAGLPVGPSSVGL